MMWCYHSAELEFQLANSWDFPTNRGNIFWNSNHINIPESKPAGDISPYTGFTIDCSTVLAWWLKDWQCGMRHGFQMVGVVYLQVNIDWETSQLHCIWAICYVLWAHVTDGNCHHSSKATDCLLTPGLGSIQFRNWNCSSIPIPIPELELELKLVELKMELELKPLELELELELKTGIEFFAIATPALSS